MLLLFLFCGDCSFRSKYESVVVHTAVYFFPEDQRQNLLKVFIPSEIHFTIHLHLFLATNASDILTLLSQQPALSSCCVCSPTNKSLYIFVASYTAFNLKIVGKYCLLLKVAFVRLFHR